MKQGIVFLTIALDILVLSLIISSCSARYYSATRVSHKPPVDTRSRDIEYQVKKAYNFDEGSLVFDNMFDGARLNNCEKLNDSTYTVTIKAENYPVNMSPWYSFRIVSTGIRSIYINIEYIKAKHRYYPKISNDMNLWVRVDSSALSLYDDTSGITLQIKLNSDTTWISAQELEPSEKVLNYWSEKLKGTQYETVSIGESKKGRPLTMFDIYKGDKKRKPIIALFSRQHPPEVTGYYAMKAFLNRILEDDQLSDDFLNRYRVIVFPIINPDGVDLGHWRHNTGGVDLNRDWGIYNQDEVRLVADRLVSEAKINRADLVLGIDFHSTSRDIYYTNKADASTMKLGKFKDKWLDAMDQYLPAEKYKESRSDVYPGLTTKNWFYNQFKAVGITYEIGDEKQRSEIQFKGELSARLMMEILLDIKEY